MRLINADDKRSFQKKVMHEPCEGQLEFGEVK